jgi:hypothetical protein
MKWISVNDQLPEVSKDILFCDEEKVYFGFYGYKTTDRERLDLGFIDKEMHSDAIGYAYFEENITHWMPIPKPPKK